MKCIIKSCGRKFGDGTQPRLFPFPIKDAARLKLWIDACGGESIFASTKVENGNLRFLCYT